MRGQQGKKERGGTQHGGEELWGGAALGVDERGHRGTRARGEQGNGGLDGWETADLVRLRYGQATVARRRRKGRERGTRAYEATAAAGYSLENQLATETNTAEQDGED